MIVLGNCRRADLDAFRNGDHASALIIAGDGLKAIEVLDAARTRAGEKCSIFVATWRIGPRELRRLVGWKESGHPVTLAVGASAVRLDRTGKWVQEGLAKLDAHVVDSHMKLFVCIGPTAHVVVSGSGNMTNNLRREQYQWTELPDATHVRDAAISAVSDLANQTGVRSRRCRRPTPIEQHVN